MDNYDISQHTTTGGLDMNEITNTVRQYLSSYPMVILGLIIVLVITVIWLLVKKEHFNPTQTLKMTQQEVNGWESLDPSRAGSVFAQTVQSPTGGSFSIDPSAAPGAPGSLAYQVLHSSDFNCGNRVPVGNDAWEWMLNVANAPGESFKPKNDNDFSRVLTGH